MAINYNRKLLPVQKVEAYLSSDTLPQALAKIEKWIKEYGDTAYFSEESDLYSESDQRYLHVYRDEPETDEQYNTRIAQEEVWAKQADIQERLVYERLQKKFST